MYRIGEFAAAQIAGTVPQKPLNAEKWGKCFITVPPHTPFHLFHFIFLLDSHISDSTTIFASAAKT